MDYAARRFRRRAMALVDVLLPHVYTRSCVERCRDVLGGLLRARSRLRVASLGGGPGCDFAASLHVAGAAPAALGLGVAPAAVTCTVLDFEPAWESCVRAVDGSLRGAGSRVGLEPCDLTQPFEGGVNARLREAVLEAHLVTFCYVLHEIAAALLREGGSPAAALLGGAVPGVLAHAAPGAVVVALDASGFRGQREGGTEDSLQG
ncbi:unnamed protein product [Prorocentrum cordatum]|uniref:Uncharacterized protein n=1 Tax=Prorocentrum cordatum TaxID=2364126 RepID=A0ABN9VB99_9DINO|nr:unnamed protein product [Polarella glacialis]